MSSTFEEEYTEISGVLMEYGGLVTPLLVGGVWDALRQCCAEIRLSGPQQPSDRAAAERRINEILETHVFNPSAMAYLIYRALNTQHLSDYSYLVELAAFHYYKSEFASSISVMLPAVEGVLRSYAGWSFKQFLSDGQDLKSHELRKYLINGKALSEPERHSLYASSLATFHERWLFVRTAKADFNLSYLNRNYVLHQLGTNCFYRSIDCHRLFLFFDLFAELLALEGKGVNEPFTPHGVAAIDRRQEHYERLQDGALTVSQARSTEDMFLREHRTYVPQPRMDADEILQRVAKIMFA